VPGTPRGGHARHRQERAARLRSSVPARDLLFRASGTRRAKAGACKSRLAGPRCGNASAAANATGIGWCQRVAGRKPHSRARIDGSSGVPVRRIRLQKSANVVEVQRSVLPVGNGARGQGPSSRGLRKESRGSAKASRTSTAVAKPWSWESPEPGAREGVAGQRFLLDGRHLGSLIRLARSRDRAEGGLGGFHGCAGRASDVTHVGEATGMPEVRITRIATGRERPPR
jgi:hypothetical protein